MTRRSSEEGALVIELVIAVTVILTGIMGTVVAFSSYLRATSSAREQDEATIGLENVAEILKDRAFDGLYDTYHDTEFVVPGLVGANGDPARVLVTCHVDETNIPAMFGPIEDLDGDPDQYSANCATNYKILPVELSLTHQTQQGQLMSRQLHLILSDD